MRVPPGSQRTCGEPQPHALPARSPVKPLQVQKAVCLAHSMAMQGVPVDPGLHAVLLSACLAVGAWDQAVMLCTAAQAAQVGERVGRQVCGCSAWCAREWEAACLTQAALVPGFLHRPPVRRPPMAACLPTRSTPARPPTPPLTLAYPSPPDRAPAPPPPPPSTLSSTPPWPPASLGSWWSCCSTCRPAGWRWIPRWPAWWVGLSKAGQGDAGRRVMDIDSSAASMVGCE